MVAIFHHHLLPAVVITITTMMFHLANATSYKAYEEDESYYDKEP
ncbi:MAG: hypothetical protein WCQ90_15930 [Deltaproteobacteria bacterium]